MDSDAVPALLGGAPSCPNGPPEWPLPDDDIQQALLHAWENGSWGKYHGDHLPQLESRLAEYHHCPVLTCGSGTYAIELALRALKLKPGDEVIMSAYDYPGNFLNLHALQLTPVLVDLSPHNRCLRPDAIEEAVSEKTRAVLVSHLHGGMVPMSEVMAVAERCGLKVIEDAAQCPGAIVEGKRAGTTGHIGILSFGGSKLLTAGRGGAVLSHDPALLQRARLIQNRGNVVCPLSEMQAAVLLPQLAKLDERNAYRQCRVQRLTEGLADVPGLMPFENGDTDCSPAFYKVGFQFDAESFGLSRERFVEAIRAEGVALDNGFRAIHVQRSPSRYRKVGSLQEANRAHQGILVLHHPVLLGSDEAIDRIVDAIRKCWSHRAKL